MNKLPILSTQEFIEWRVANPQYNFDWFIGCPQVYEDALKMAQAEKDFAIMREMCEALNLVIQRASEPLFRQAFEAIGQGGMVDSFALEASVALDKVKHEPDNQTG